MDIDKEKSIDEIYDLILECSPKYKNIFNIDGNQWVNELKRRSQFIDIFGFSVPCREVVDDIKNFVGKDKIIEIGSGRGIWSCLFRKSGITTIATDIGSTGGYYRNFDNVWTDIEIIECNVALKKYTDCNCIFMSWPPYLSSMAYNVLNTFKGNKMIYIGEDPGGCCADNDFFDLIDREWIQVTEYKHEIPKWIGIHDTIKYYIRRE